MRQRPFFQDFVLVDFCVHVGGSDDRSEKVTGRMTPEISCRAIESDDRDNGRAYFKGRHQPRKLYHDSWIAPVQRQSDKSEPILRSREKKFGW